MAGYANRTYRFLMRDIGTITGGGNGLQGVRIAYASVNGSFDTYSMKQPDLYYFEAIKMTSQA